jgi:hypothetical protein
MRHVARILDKMRVDIADIYAFHSSFTHETALDIMAAETWLTGSEAVAVELADEEADSDAIAAAWNLERFENAPSSIRALAASAWRRLKPDDRAGRKKNQDTKMHLRRRRACDRQKEYEVLSAELRRSLRVAA